MHEPAEDFGSVAAPIACFVMPLSDLWAQVRPASQTFSSFFICFVLFSKTDFLCVTTQASLELTEIRLLLPPGIKGVRCYSPALTSVLDSYSCAASL